MKKALLFIFISHLINHTGFAQFPTTTSLNSLSITNNTREKPQSKVWMHDGKHWTVLSNTDGAHVWRLDGTTWTRILTLYSKNNRRADCKVDGNLVHVYLFREDESDLFSLEYVPANKTYKLWTARPQAVRIPCDRNSETATIDIDTNGRMWLASDEDDKITVRWSDSPYANWSSPITVETGIDPDDIGAVIAFPMFNKIGIFWSNQITKRWGFKMHADGTDPNTWSTDEVPASQSALNIGNGMSDDHLNMALSSNGTLYCAIKTSYDTPGYPRIALLIRRPSGTWDNLYGVSEYGTRGIVVLNEQTGKIRVIFASDEHDGDILYRESATSNINFGSIGTLISGNYNNPTSIKSNFTSEVVILASSSSDAIGVLATDNGTPPPPLPGAPTLISPLNNALNIPKNPTLSWNAVSSATSYQVQLSTNSNFTTIISDSNNITATQLSIPGLAYSTNYFWRVRANNVSGSGLWSTIRNFTTEAEPIVVPDVPTLNLPANNATGIAINPTFSWNTANSAVKYRLQVAITSNFTNLVQDSSNISQLSLQLLGLNYNTQYFWRVKSYSQNGESNWSAARNFTTTTAPSTPPNAPLLASPANNSTGNSLNPNLQWNATPNGISYQLQVATDGNFLTPMIDMSNISTLSASLSNLAFSTKYFWRVRAHNAAGPGTWSVVWSFTTLSQQVSLVGHWQMEDGPGTTLADASGNGNHATTFGGPTFGAGAIGQALQLNGSNQYATVPSNAQLSPSNSITLAAWIKAANSGSRQIILKKGDSQDGYELSITGSLRTLFRYNQETAGKDYQVTSSYILPANGQTWAHIAATFDGTTIKIYINGVLEKSETYSNPPAINSNNEAFSIGASSSGSNRFEGSIDDARIYNIALTGAQISALATLPAPRMAAPQIAQPMQTALDATPNPFSLNATINFTVPESGDYQIILYNMTGNPVKVLKKGIAKAGEKLSARLDGDHLQLGLYMVRLQTSSTAQTMKLIHE